MVKKVIFWGVVIAVGFLFVCLSRIWLNYPNDYENTEHTEIYYEEVEG